MEPVPMPLPDNEARARLARQVDVMGRGLLERDEAVRLALLAALAGEHLLLLGPPGTAKSQLARRLHEVIGEADYFERMLTRFTTPEELFGPLSLKALDDDRYERLTSGYLPRAGVAFLDEVFKASSAILNTLLTLTHERVFDNGTRREPVPLVTLVAASNEPPDDAQLAAFFDRFLLRVPVAPVSDAAFEALLALPATEPAPPAHLPTWDRAGRDALAARAAALPLQADAQSGLQSLRRLAAARGLAVSDRRWRKLVALLRVQAAAEGRPAVDAVDLWLAPHALAADADSHAALADWVDQAMVGPSPAGWPALSQTLMAFAQQLDRERQPRESGQDDTEAGKLALAQAAAGVQPSIGDAMAGMRLVARAMEDARSQPPATTRLHRDTRVAQLDELAAQLEGLLAEETRGDADFAAHSAGRPLLPPALRARWLRARDERRAHLEGLRHACGSVREGFAALPLRPESAAAAAAAADAAERGDAART